MLQMMHCSIAVIDSVQTDKKTLIDDRTDSQPYNLIILRANVSASNQYCIIPSCCTVVPEHSLMP